MRKIFGILIIKICVLLLLSYSAGFLMPFRETFPYRILLTDSGLPQFIQAFGNFDGVHYLHIAQQGYHEFDQAFFPLYPLLINLFSRAMQGNYFVAAILLSNTALFFTVYFFYNVIKEKYSESHAFWATLFLLAYPTSFYLNAIYTESLFLCLFFGSLYFTLKQKRIISGVLAGFSSATRLFGVFTSIPLMALIKKKGKRLSTADLIFVAIPFLGLFIYMLFLYVSIQQPFAFFTVQKSLGVNRSTELILLPQVYFRYIKIFFFSRVDLAYGVAVAEFIFFNGALLIALKHLRSSLKKKDEFGLSLAGFSLITLLIPTFTGTFASMTRYSLVAISTYVMLAGLTNTKKKMMTLSVFFACQVALFTLFIRGYFVG